MNNQIPYSQLKDYELVDKNQDIRGWPVKDGAGTQLGTVRELLVDTERERVTTLVLDNGKSLPAQDVTLSNHTVLLGARSGLGATNTTANMAGTTGNVGARTGEQSIPVVEEFLRVGKREVNAGGVKVETHVIERPVQEQVQLRQEHVSVERRPVNREISPTDAAQLRDQSIEMTARSEEAVVAKVARVIEEIVLKKDIQQTTQTINDTVKHTDVRVDDLAFDTTAYRPHYDTQYAKSGYSYDQFAPAYKFGHTMRGDSRFSGRSWNDVEPHARTAWEQRNPGTWEHFKDAVQHAWSKVTGS